jgi:hypothetical protein
VDGRDKPGHDEKGHAQKTFAPAASSPQHALAFFRCTAHKDRMSRFDRSDFSVVVKLRAPPPKSWRWEIYRAARSSPVQQSAMCFETMVEAQRAGKEALEEYLEKYPA